MGEIMACLTTIPRCAALVAVLALAALPTRASEIVYPTAGGTLVDGGIFGSFDGVADGWNWMFGPGGFSGAVTLATQTPASTVEHRMVCEYDLGGLSIETPISATLTLTTRGAGAVPFPDVTLQVYSYPADLIGSPDDFSAEPTALQGVLTVTPMQAPTALTIDVSQLVTGALNGSHMVAFRFQIDPDTPHAINQVFIDALDSAPETKPFLTVRSGMPADADDDGDVDLDDFAILVDCLAGPGHSPDPAMPGVSAADCLWAFDRDSDADVDLDDLSALLGSFVPQ